MYVSLVRLLSTPFEGLVHSRTELTKRSSFQILMFLTPLAEVTP